ncbi:hypothetical protein GMA8713_01617 [Grimontia marina]|uniref:Uncharacterized protein n=1 Tax=Grimontia marina TaxID=646534 RepID=A0A128F216_9GAMM|nr:hypothetical protein GMA8713_01617 [Grimontia marina]
MMHNAVRQKLGVSIALKQSLSLMADVASVAIDEFKEQHPLCIVTTKQRPGSASISCFMDSVTSPLTDSIR